MSGRGKAQKSLDLIAAAHRILDEIQPATVRAVCYRLFVEGFIPNMSRGSTNRVGVQLRDAREDGTIPWEWVVDETRRPESVAMWRNPQDIFDESIHIYRRDAWQDQPDWIEVWSEKGTVRGTLGPILDKYGVTFRVMHGHGSATTVHDVATMADASAKRLTVLYVGDRDPSGMHMSELDLPGRLGRYSSNGSNIDISRVAITKRDRAIPSFPAGDKVTDPRYKWYVAKYGHRCWELDALSPVILRNRVEQAILARLDMAAWAHAEMIEAVQVESMQKYVGGWTRSISRQALKYSTRPKLV